MIRPNIFVPVKTTNTKEFSNNKNIPYVGRYPNCFEQDQKISKNITIITLFNNKSICETNDRIEMIDGDVQSNGSWNKSFRTNFYFDKSYSDNCNKNWIMNDGCELPNTPSYIKTRDLFWEKISSIFIAADAHHNIGSVHIGIDVQCKSGQTYESLWLGHKHAMSVCLPNIGLRRNIAQFRYRARRVPPLWWLWIRVARSKSTKCQ